MDIDVLTIVVALIVGIACLLVGRRHPFPLLAALVVLLPFRDFSQRWLNAHTDLPWQTVNALARWWFVLLLVLGMLAAFRLAESWRARGGVPRPDAVDVLLALVLLVSGLATVLSPNLGAAITSLRGYLQPLVVFAVARVFLPSRKELRILLTLWLIAGAIVAAFALVQAFTWDAEVYRAEGYVRQDGQLVVPEVGIGGRTYLRPASTVSGPNELGLDMVLLFLLALHVVSIAGPRLRLLAGASAVLFAAGLAVSYSRSAFVGLLASLACLGALWLVGRRRGGLPVQASPRRYAYAVVLAVTVLLALITSGFLRLIWETLTALSQQYHYVDSVEAVRFLLTSPAGVGMGLVEPKGALELQTVEAAFHVEGSLFQIGLEMGVWGLATWLAFWAAGLVATIRRGWWSSEPLVRTVSRTAVCGWVAALVAFLFLPLMQSVTLMVWLWLLLGLGVESRRMEESWRGVPATSET